MYLQAIFLPVTLLEKEDDFVLHSNLDHYRPNRYAKLDWVVCVYIQAEGNALWT